MRRDDELAPVQRPRPCEIVEKEIDAMHVHDVGIADVTENRQCDRVSFGTEVGDAHDFEAVEPFMLRQTVWFGGIEDAVERDDPYLMPVRALGAGEILDDILHPAHGRMKLPHDVRDAHVCCCPEKTLSANADRINPFLIKNCARCR